MAGRGETTKRAKAAGGRPAKASGAARATRPAAAVAGRPWGERALWMLLGLFVLHLALNAVTVIPVHFDEAQYWAYGNEHALGHYSKPPLTGWLIELATLAFGDTPFGLRFFAPVSHLVIGALIYLTAARLFDPRTGFWAAFVYSLAPGVLVSAHLMTTDPVMMMGWSVSLYALVRVMEPRAKGAREPWGWWVALGAGVGLAMLGKYTGIAFAAGALGYAALGREGPASASARKGAWVAAAAGVVVLSPNLVWNALNGFVTFTHLEQNASYDAGPTVEPISLLEFLGAQLGVIGPVAFGAVVAGLVSRARGTDWRDRLMVWMTAPLLAVMCVQAFLSGANANWAAPAYVAGSVLAARWLLVRDWGPRALRVHGWIGGAALAVVWALGLAYANFAQDLPRAGDPFKKMRVGGPFCEMALTAMEAEGADALLSDNRRRLSECMFQGGLGFRSVAAWDPDGVPEDHFEFRARLQPGDDRLMLLAVHSEGAGEDIAAHFASAIPVGSGTFRTHDDRTESYALWLVEGFEGY